MAATSPSPYRRALAACSSAAVLCLPATAQAQTSWAVQTSASAGVETNPYLSQGSGAAVTGTLDVQPSIVVQRPLTTLQLTGDAQGTFYTNGIPARETLSLNGSGTHRVSERTTLTAQLGFTDDIVGTAYAGRIPFIDPLLVTTPSATDQLTDPTAAATVPATTPLPSFGLPVYINDPALGGLGRRRQTYQLGGSIGTLISARDSLTLGTAVSINRFGGLDDFNDAVPSISWQHVLGEGFSIGTGFQASFIDYLGSAQGDATTYGPTVNVTRAFGDGLTASASVGLVFTNLHDLIGGTRTTQSVSGSLGLCRQRPRGSLCLTATRQVAPSAFEGVRTVTIAGATYAYRLTPNSSVQAALSYSHADDPLERGLVGFGNDATDYGSASGSYSRRLGRALSGFVSASYAQAFGNRTGRGADVSAQLGVSYRFTPRP